MTYPSRYAFVLAVAISSPGFAFVLFEGPETLLEVGVKQYPLCDKNALTIEAVAALISRYRPEAIVLEETADPSSRRCPRVRKLSRALVSLAEREFVQVFRYSRNQVKEYFSLAGATTKYEIAGAVARMIPAFASRMPRERKQWRPEDVRQSLFDAAALGLTFYRDALGNEVVA